MLVKGATVIKYYYHWICLLALLTKLLSGDCHLITFLCGAQRHAVTRTNDGPDECRLMAVLCHNELKVSIALIWSAHGNRKSRVRFSFFRAFISSASLGTIFKTFPLTHTMGCRYNAVNFLTNCHKRHRMVHSSFVDSASYWYSPSVPAIIYAISNYIGPRYNGTRLYSLL